MKYKKLKTLWTAIKRDLGYNEAQIERALDLDRGTIKKALKMVAPPPGLVHILKIVYTYPWILKVIDRGYDQKFARKEMLKHAVDILVETTCP